MGSQSQTRLSNCTHFSVIWGQYTMFSILSLLRVHPGVGVGGRRLLDGGHSVSSLRSLRAHRQGGLMAATPFVS